jgi:hypothetical protein
VSAVTVFMCGNCLALVGAIFCFLAMQAIDQGQIADAESKLKIGKTVTIVGFALFALGWVAWIIWYVVYAATMFAT